MEVKKITIHNFRGILDASITLHDYSLLVGPNNAGKSAVIDAIRAFYEKDKFAFKKERDLPFAGAEDAESWIELEFGLSDDEYASLADEYKLADNTLRVRKFFQTASKTHDKKPRTGSIFGYKTDVELSDEPFYGAKNVQSGKFGDIIYIPAVSKVDEHAKLSGPSALRDLLADVLKDVVEASKTFTKFNEDFQSFASSIKTEEAGDGRSLVGLESELNKLLGSWGAKFNLRLNTPSTASIIKNMVSYDFLDEAHGKPQEPEQFGSGFQRHFIYSLIQVGARYVGTKSPKKTKEFTPTMTLILFEEPEAFLHPPQQEALSASLRELCDTPNRQVVCSTHSPHFVSKNTANIPSIIRLKRTGAIMTAHQIDEKAWEEIVDANQAINLIAQKWKNMAKKLAGDDLKPEMEAVKHFLWLNPDRCGLFFADFVLAVEGVTDQVFINKLIDDGKINKGDCGLYVLDCLGKYNIHRFMNLLSNLGIPHAVIHDDDESNNEHAEINALIEDSKHADLTLAVEQIKGDLEQFLGVTLPKASHRKPQHLLYQYESGKIADEKIVEFATLVESCLPNEDANQEDEKSDG